MSRYSIFLMRFAFNSSIPVSLIHIKRQYGHNFNLHMYLDYSVPNVRRKLQAHMWL